MPVSARRSDVLPWSMWPAVPTTRVKSGSPSAWGAVREVGPDQGGHQRAAQRSVVGRVDGTQVEQDRAVLDGRRRRAHPGAGIGRGPSAERTRVTRSADRGHGPPGTPRRRPSHEVRRHPRAVRRRSAGPSCIRRRAPPVLGRVGADGAPDGDVAGCALRPGRGPGSRRGGQRRLVRSHRARQRVRRNRATRSARPRRGPPAGHPGACRPRT